ncbi:hypothetical protein MUP77_11210 [Candidatus Bathyarchaeota archaeon]|nr:hypothetical protein [Candidatus Bathyarchaeota archaeon]
MAGKRSKNEKQKFLDLTGVFPSEREFDCVSCRHFEAVWMRLPCEQKKDGFCGIDGRGCDLRSV